MHIQQISNQSFGRIYLRESYHKNGREIHKIYPARPIDVNKTGQTNLYDMEGNLVDRVIECDYNKKTLRTRYNELIAEQMNNPNHIMIDVFPSDVPVVEKYFQIAYVGKKAKVFEQAVGYWRGQPRPSTIDFLEDACKYANKLALEQWKKTHKLSFIEKLLG